MLTFSVSELNNQFKIFVMWHETYFCYNNNAQEAEFALHTNKCNKNEGSLHNIQITISLEALIMINLSGKPIFS